VFEELRDRFENNHVGSIGNDDFSFCCGVQELKCDDIAFNYRHLLLALHSHLNGYASVVITDNNSKQRHHKELTKIVAPIDLGKNPNTGNRLYMWVITADRFKAYVNGL
jgi:hypothetical protein